MEHETALSFGKDTGGEAASVKRTSEEITFARGKCFDYWMAETLKAYDEDGSIKPLNELRRKWLHKKLDEWIDKKEFDNE